MSESLATMTPKPPSGATPASRHAAPLLSVIIPVYNEQATLAEVVSRIEQLGCSKEILIVDDGSTDGTAERARALGERPGVRVFVHERNRGKGAAIRTGLKWAIGDIVVVQDADLEYEPAEIERLLEPIAEGTADVVYGSRFAFCSRVPPKLEDDSFGKTALQVLHRAANRLLTWVSNRLTGLHLTDMETCYKAMRREVIEGLVLRENRFGFEPEITAKIARRRWRVVELPVSYQGRSRAAGKKIGIVDGLRAIWCIVRYSRRD